MSCLSWNCQGLGNLWTVRALQGLIRDFSPKLVFLMETKMDDHGFDGLRSKLNMFGLGVSAIGRSGGLALLWEKDVSVTILSYSKNHIDANIQLRDSSTIWRFTGFYGEPDTNLRKRTWHLLKHLGTVSGREWAVMGDYNEILSHNEKLGGVPTPEWRLRDFRETLTANDLVDLGYFGYPFTWTNNRETPNNTKERLDRVCVTPSWQSIFPSASVQHLVVRRSDHQPLLLRLTDPRPRHFHRPRRFRFEAIWVRKADCHESIRAAWNREDDIVSNIENCSLGLMNWSRNTFPNIRKAVRDLNLKLDELNRLPYTAEIKEQERKLKVQLEEFLDQEEILWKQRAKAQWLVEGDRNTRFFHSQASKRAQQNLIEGLEDLRGELQSDLGVMGQIAVEYFSEIFASMQPEGQCVEEVVRTMRPKVDQSINQNLARVFTPEEPTRGLRQGDPLSPYLFLFCTEAFSSLLANAEDRGVIRGVRVSASAPSISHLLFADDTLIFCEARRESAIEINNILHMYSAASGQIINLDKSTVVFSRNASTNLIEEVRDILPVRVVDKHEKYLGLPTELGKSKREVFSWIRERLWSKTQGFGEKQLSKAGKEVLIKSVLQSIPTYVMSCFKLPEYLLHELESVISNFWWGDGKKNRIHWVRWDSLCDSKKAGGMGFRDLSAFNSALLGKQIWRIIHYPGSLLSRVLKAKYFPHCDVLDAQPNSNASFTWKSIFGTIEMVKSGLVWSIGTGEAVRVWDSNWIPRASCFKPRTPDLYQIGNITVATFLKPNGEGWDINLLNCVFWKCDVDEIIQIPICANARPDCLRWFHSRNGHYTVRSGYYVCRTLKSVQKRNTTASSSTPCDDKDWIFIWRIKVPNKLRVFLWRLLKNGLPVYHNLIRRKLNFASCCPVCLGSDETVAHIFKTCHFARLIWALSGLPCHVITVSIDDMWYWIFHVKHVLRADQFEFFVCVLWCIWHHRNCVVHCRKTGEPHELIAFAMDYVHRYKAAPVHFSDPRPPEARREWVPPTGATIKINTDAATFRSLGAAGAGIIARDSAGRIIAWRQRRLTGIYNAEIAESLAILHGVDLALDEGWTDVEIESDCKTVIEAINLPETCLSVGAQVIATIKNKFSLFRSIVFCHIFRAANSLAHDIAGSVVNDCDGRLELPL